MHAVGVKIIYYPCLIQQQGLFTTPALLQIWQPYDHLGVSMDRVLLLCRVHSFNSFRI